MTKKSFLFIFISILIFGCSKEDVDMNFQASAEVEQKTLNFEDGLSEQQHSAIDLVNLFYDQISNDSPESKSGTISNLSLTDTKTLYFSHNSNTKSTDGTKLDSINTFTFDLDVDGKQGFAIASGNELIGRVYAFVEKGSLEDTANIHGMAQIIRNIPLLIERDIKAYNSEVSTTKSVSIPYVYGPYIKTAWNQTSPYNYGSPTNGACTNNTFYYAGCGVIAMAQTVAYYEKCSGNYDFSALTAQSTISTWSSSYLQNEVSSFIEWLGSYANLRADYDCDGTSTKMKDCNNVLKKYGYARHYATTNDVSDSRLYNSIKTENVVLSAGVRSGDVGHMWIFDGLTGQANSDGSLSTIATVHCNWGWGGSSDGWYAAYNNMYNAPNPDASDDDPTNGSSESGSRKYYKDNAYIYISE